MTLIILGAGGYVRTVADIAEQEGKYDKIIFLDDSKEAEEEKTSAFLYSVSDDTEFYRKRQVIGRILSASY